MAQKGYFPDELLSHVDENYLVLSKDILEIELYVLYINYIFPNVKSVCVIWNLVKENIMENTIQKCTN
jgi:hypothetical protein